MFPKGLLNALLGSPSGSRLLTGSANKVEDDVRGRSRAIGGIVSGSSAYLWAARRAICAAIAGGVLLIPAVSVGGDSTQQAPASSDKPHTETVTVEAQRQREAIRHEVATFVTGIIIRPRSYEESVARWQTPICPLVAGLPHDQGEFVLAGLSQAARNAGAPLDGGNCQANFIVVVAAEPNLLLQKWRTHSPRMFEPQVGEGAVQLFLASTRPIRVWYNPSTACGGGALTLSLTAGNYYPTCSNVPFSRLTRPATRGMASVIVVVDAGHIQGLNIGQLTDYIAMIGMAEIRWESDPDPGPVPTILHLFDNAADARPQRLSNWDQAFLKALYQTPAADTMQISEMETKVLTYVAPK